jgi:hypothetical protein
MVSLLNKTWKSARSISLILKQYYNSLKKNSLKIVFNKEKEYTALNY